MNTSDPQTTFTEALQVFFWSMMTNIHTCLPARIDKYDYKNRKASVKPLIMKKLTDGSTQDLPVISNVPVIIPGTLTTGFSFPVNKGDLCILLFSERALEKWLSSGSNEEPGDPRKFDLSDAIAIPGIFSFNQNNPAPNNDDVHIYNKSQTITIKKNGDIEVGSSSLRKLVTEDILSIFNAHVHTATSFGAATSPPQDGPTYPALATMLSTHLTQKVKVQ